MLRFSLGVQAMLSTPHRLWASHSKELGTRKEAWYDQDNNK